jgi:hypothetical protein
MLLQRIKVWLGRAGLGAALAIAAAIALSPGFIAWRYEPPEHSELSCAPAVRSALQSLVRIELWSAAGGGFLGLLILSLLARRTAKNAPGGAEDSRP